MNPVRDPAANLPPEATARACRQLMALGLLTLAAFVGGYTAFLLAANHFGG